MKSFASEHPQELFIGIDPGASGGIACFPYYCGGINGVTATPLKFTNQEIWRWISAAVCGLKTYPFHPFAMIESNTGYVGDGGNPGSAMFKFGKSHGMLEMALIAAGIPYEQVTPAVWQRKLGIPPKKRDEKSFLFKLRVRLRCLIGDSNE